MNLSEITYTMDDPTRAYGKDLDAADTLEKLHAALAQWRPIADDAFRAAQAWDEATFLEWRKALRVERRRRFMGAEAADKFGAVLLPAIMVQVGLVASHFRAPWGCAYFRLRDLGSIVEREGIALPRKLKQ